MPTSSLSSIRPCQTVRRSAAWRSATSRAWWIAEAPSNTVSAATSSHKVPSIRASRRQGVSNSSWPMPTTTTKGKSPTRCTALSRSTPSCAATAVYSAAAEPPAMARANSSDTLGLP